MNNPIIIAIDAMGGENAPNKNIEGVSLFLKKNKKKNDVFFNLYGDEDLIKKELAKYNISTNFYKIFPFDQNVSCIKFLQSHLFNFVHLFTSLISSITDRNCYP